MYYIFAVGAHDQEFLCRVLDRKHTTNMRFRIVFETILAPIMVQLKKFWRARDHVFHYYYTSIPFLMEKGSFRRNSPHAWLFGQCMVLVSASMIFLCRVRMINISLESWLFFTHYKQRAIFLSKHAHFHFDFSNHRDPSPAGQRQ